ncbi:MAG: glycosyltransferase family 4 protein [Anaerolineae bacterium]|nr:glycosyltransferase family 4 protein [Gemmatimonadaceae bacterium]
MRLLLVNWNDRENPHAGGAELHLHQIFGRLASRGHDVTLLCSGWKGCQRRVTLDGINIHRIGTRYTFPFTARRYYSATFATAGFDVLIEDLNKIPLFTPRWRGPRVLALVHHLFGVTAFREASLPVAAAVWLAERPLARAYRGVPFQAVSESTAMDLVTRGVPRQAIRVIFNGIETERFTPDPSQRSATPLFAYLGRLKKYKGVELVLRAFAQLAHPTASLVIAGSGDYRPRLESISRSLDLGDRVRFLGFIPETEKLALLRRAWALVFASPKEGWGLTNLEGAACGTPAVVSDSPGLRESVIGGRTGILVPHGDISAMAAALGKFAASSDMVRVMGAAARTFAERFTWDAAATETEEHLLEVVRAEKGNRGTGR